MVSAQDLEFGSQLDTIASAAGADVASGPARLRKIVLTGGAAAGTLTVYDSATASGTELMVLKVAAGETVTAHFGPTGVRLATGLSWARTPVAPVANAPVGGLLFVRD